MHKYRIRTGKYAGIHYIYTEEEAKKKKIRYHDDWVNARPKEWALTDDGYVVECLDRYQMINRQKQIVISYRFPFILIPASYDVKVLDISKIPREYLTIAGKVKKTPLIYDVIVENAKVEGIEIFIRPNGRLEWGLRRYSRTTFSGENRSYPKRLTGRAKLFIEYLRAGLDPISAYMKAFNYFHPKYEYIKYRVFRLLENEAVIKHLTETGAMDDFIKELEKHGITNDYLIREIKRTIDDNKVSSQVRASMIAMILKIKGLLNPNKSIQIPSGNNGSLGLPSPQSVGELLERKLNTLGSDDKILDIDYETLDSESN